MRDTIDMAREAGYMRTVHGGAEVSMASMDCLKSFEALVRADERARIIAENELVIERVNEHIEHLNAAVLAEREVCAKVCEEAGMFHEVSQWADLAFDLASAIRARGNT